ncbi:rod shape-determining protein MreC [Pararhodonellum marinum]|uniref:rod shape-determining protein MreC n=1 Tax=Pararhodonellum marinum TaxID=2755358 RepID=UPI00188EDF7F|nr:rod shape-determining protein MreC [Pararhodonellum marinum]
MQRILLFLYRIRSFLLFVLLESLAIWFIVNNNSPQGAVFFNSSNNFIGTILSSKDNFTSYFSLSSANEALVEKNTELLKKLDRFTQPKDSVYLVLDSSLSLQHEFRSALVINNSLHFNQNYLTLNKGSRHGIKAGMGVFNEQGVIGRVKGVSKNFSTVISLLHTDNLISSKVKSSEVFGSTKWDGRNPRQAKLLYVPRHVILSPGDTIVTSGYNAVFPEGILVGRVTEIGQGADTNYLDITLELSTDFSRLNYVYLVENLLKTEMDSLYDASGIIIDE